MGRNTSWPRPGPRDAGTTSFRGDRPSLPAAGGLGRCDGSSRRNRSRSMHGASPGKPARPPSPASRGRAARPDPGDGTGGATTAAGGRRPRPASRSAGKSPSTAGLSKQADRPDQPPPTAASPASAWGRARGPPGQGPASRRHGDRLGSSRGLPRSSMPPAGATAASRKGRLCDPATRAVPTEPSEEIGTRIGRSRTRPASGLPKACRSQPDTLPSTQSPPMPGSALPYGGKEGTRGRRTSRASTPWDTRRNTPAQPGARTGRGSPTARRRSW